VFSLSRENLARELNEDSLLARVKPGVVPTQRWEPNGSAVEYGRDWTRFRIEHGEAHRHDALELMVIEERSDVERTISIVRIGGKWTTDRVMEAATAFIKRGTRVRLRVELLEDHVVVKVRHGLHQDIEKGISLDEEPVERALAEHRRVLEMPIPMRAAQARVMAYRAMAKLRP
jgi:hypothetical protein